MRLFVPSYYTQFHCIAGACRHSCCIGWEIDIAPDTLGKYRCHKGALAERFSKDIAETEDGASFVLGAGERCPFLNNRNLCDIILTMGEENLCEICADHPRFRNFLSDRTEMGLGLCCEEAARIILSQTEPMRLVCMEDDGSSEECAEEELEALAFRDACLFLAVDDALPLAQRLLRLCPPACLSTPQFWAGVLLPLPRLDAKWTDSLAKFASLPVFPAIAPEYELPCMQLLSYFLFRHVLAEHPFSLQAKAAFAALLAQLVWTVFVCEGGDFSAFCDTARMTSAEIEYAQENIDAILSQIERLAQCP